MQKRSTASDLIPIDLEINATCRRRIAERNRNFLLDIEAESTPREELDLLRHLLVFLLKGNLIQELEETLSWLSSQGE